VSLSSVADHVHEWVLAMHPSGVKLPVCIAKGNGVCQVSYWDATQAQRVPVERSGEVEQLRREAKARESVVSTLALANNMLRLENERLKLQLAKQ
jgi:hypothetical protein